MDLFARLGGGEVLEHPQHPPRYGPAMGLALAKATGPGDSQIQGKRENTDGGDESGGVVVVVMHNKVRNRSDPFNIQGSHKTCTSNRLKCLCFIYNPPAKKRAGLSVFLR